MPAAKTFDEETCRAILGGISDGKPLSEICRGDGMPHPTTFRRWCDAGEMVDSEPLAIAYARAREVGFDALADQCLTIADDSSNDVRVVGDDDREVCNTEFVQRAKLRVETRLKLLAKWDPKRYGDKIDVTSGNQPIHNLSDEALEARIASKLKALG